MNEQYMKRAIELAKKGTGKVNPNPLVGAVIVKGDRIIAEGYHAAYGELHAERHAFSNLTEDAHGASMYVTLEPCCHHEMCIRDRYISILFLNEYTREQNRQNFVGIERIIS